MTDNPQTTKVVEQKNICNSCGCSFNVLFPKAFHKKHKGKLSKNVFVTCPVYACRVSKSDIANGVTTHG